MTSSEKRGDNWMKEYAIATGVGALYGGTNTLVGHPFDTVKTKMQAQTGFSGGVLGTCRQIVATEGPLGFYHGCVPPLWGSAIYRSAQFAVYDLLYNAATSYPALLQPVEHIFTHVKHTMHIECAAGAAAAEAGSGGAAAAAAAAAMAVTAGGAAAEAADEGGAQWESGGRTYCWMDAAGMARVGVTSGVKKVIAAGPNPDPTPDPTYATLSLTLSLTLTR